MLLHNKSINQSKLLNYLSRPQNSFEHNTNYKNSPLELQKVKSNPKVMSKSKVRTEITIENKSCTTK